MTTLVMEVLKVRAGVVQSLVGDTRVVVATMDAYCKYKAGRLGGVAQGVLDNLKTNVALCDESEAYYMDQAVVALGGVGAFETVILFGDVNQRLEDFNTHPAFTRCPWVSTSSRDGAPGQVAPRGSVAGINIDEEEDGGGELPNIRRTPRPPVRRRARSNPAPPRPRSTPISGSDIIRNANDNSYDLSIFLID